LTSSETFGVQPYNEQICDTFSPQDFYEELSREEMYMRYIFKLFHLHKEQKNFVEAAFTLDLYAKKLLVNREHEGPVNKTIESYINDLYLN